MKQERMKVLELLEAGKISAAEAKDLLDTMKKPEIDSGFFTFDGEARENMEDKISKFSAHVDNFAREFGTRVQDVYKEVEPKVKKASQAVLEKTAAVFDEISRSLNESLENARKSAESGECCCCEEEKAEEENKDDNAPRAN